MTIAICTPSHNTANLPLAALSVWAAAEKLGKKVEWHVLLNGAAAKSGLAGIAEPSDKVDLHVHRLPMGGYNAVHGVGALKHRIFSAAAQRCDVLVELDHDDELHPESLAEIELELREAPDMAFVSSDCLNKTRFGIAYGWQAEQHGELCCNRTPAICSRSLVEIFYAPNHFRAWTSEAYLYLGGHDPALTVCDDHDLLCRTYLSEIPMHHVPKPLYTQHEGREQTQVKLNGLIQRQQAAIGDKYLYPLAERAARLRDLRLLDMGGAHNAAAGYEAVDRAKGVAVEIDVAELLAAGQPLPFDTNSVGVIRAHDFLEHIPQPLIVRMLNEFYRVLAPGGWLLTSTPSTDGRGAWQDPTHCSGWNSNSWWYYTRAAQARFVPEFKGRFQLVKNKNHYPTDWHKQHEIIYNDAALWCIKGQPQIGEYLI